MMSRLLTITSCLVLGLVSASHAPAAPSTVETLSGDVCVVRDDNGNWGGTTTGITHQRGPDYQAKKVLDLSGVAQEVWTAASEVRLSVYFRQSEEITLTTLSRGFDRVVPIPVELRGSESQV
ncbi:MAG: hypothetical protein HUU20_07540 [Pirellulales bacterium]|nr:hypothetical protein [Pirellulales bacterium]